VKSPRRMRSPPTVASLSPDIVEKSIACVTLAYVMVRILRSPQPVLSRNLQFVFDATAADLLDVRCTIYEKPPFLDGTPKIIFWALVTSDELGKLDQAGI
jgi:hypothetical protein